MVLGRSDPWKIDYEGWLEGGVESLFSGGFLRFVINPDSFLAVKPTYSGFFAAADGSSWERSPISPHDRS